MKLTKFGHACIVLEEQGQKLIIDPGAFSADWGDASDVVAVVVTHVHQDHFKPEHLQAILVPNPKAVLYTTAEVAEQFKGTNMVVVKADDTASAGPFQLRFGGDMHAPIHQTLPVPHNTSVFVNDRLYYPGDSYTMPDGPVQVLALPANAPWMKVGDSMDYIASVKPRLCFPTHNGLLSDDGHIVYNYSLQAACQANGVQFAFLQPGQSLEI